MFWEKKRGGRAERISPVLTQNSEKAGGLANAALERDEMLTVENLCLGVGRAVAGVQVLPERERERERVYRKQCP